MKKVIVYLILFLLGLGILAIFYLRDTLPNWINNVHLFYLCALAGGFGGCTYCLRGVYLSTCVRKQWSNEWQPWYYIRPIVSVICGGVSYLFLRAGLLILESDTRANASQFGFLALAFIAGLNVDKFIAKIEDVAQAAWGIEKSRTAKESSEK